MTDHTFIAEFDDLVGYVVRFNNEPDRKIPIVKRPAKAPVKQPPYYHQNKWKARRF